MHVHTKPGNKFIINMLFISYTVHLKLLIVNGYLTVASSVTCTVKRGVFFFCSSLPLQFFLYRKYSNLGGYKHN